MDSGKLLLATCHLAVASCCVDTLTMFPVTDMTGQDRAENLDMHDVRLPRRKERGEGEREGRKGERQMKRHKFL